MKNRTGRVVLTAVGLLLLASLLSNVKLLRVLNSYRDQYPPTMEFVAEKKCSERTLVGSWSFEEITQGKPATTPDASRYANHARLNVAPRPLAGLIYGVPSQTEGKDGKAMRMRGEQWLSAGNNDCFTSEQFTAAAWVWLEETGAVPTIISKSTWPHNGWFLATTSIPEQRHDRQLDLAIMWPGGRMHVESGYELPLKEWHHVVVTADNIAREVQFFIDGKAYPKHRGLPKWQVNWDHELTIGDYDGSTRWPWVGRLDEVRLYNYVLSADESEGLYTATRR